MGLTQQELRDLKPWEGPRHFVLIDDVHDFRPLQQMGSGPGFVNGDQAAAGCGAVEADGAVTPDRVARVHRAQLLEFQRAGNGSVGEVAAGGQVPFLYMDNSPAEQVYQDDQEAQELPPGRGQLLIGDTDVEGVLVGVPALLGNFRPQQ